MLEPISKSTLSRTILDEITKAIMKGLWQPGSRIPNEKELATAFSVSRNSIREAVKTLNNTGILESRPGQGTFLSEDALSKIALSELIRNGYRDASLVEITEIRILLESQSAFWTTKRASDRELDELRDILKSCRESLEQDPESQDRAHLAFHDAVVRLSRNSFAIRLLSSIRAEIEAQKAKFEEIPEMDRIDLIRDQEKILQHILNREAEEARRAMEKHMNKGLLLLAPYFPEAKLDS